MGDIQVVLLQMALHELRQASRAIADYDDTAFLLHTREARTLQKEAGRGGVEDV